MSSLDKTFEVGGSFIYGRADDMYQIIKLLSSKSGTDLNSIVVSIVSDRGSGRTTLLHLLKNELCTTFNITKYICMPENFHEKRIMRLIIESLTGSHCDITDLEVLKETMKEELIDQRLLLLLDDFENKRQECWDLLLDLHKFCKGKCVIVVTATREAVATVKGPIQFYYMNNLSKEFCWMIFQKDIFSGQYTDADTELVDIGKCLVDRCRNVTLCIKMLSGLLRHSLASDWWRAVLDNNFWEVDEVNRDIIPALRVCYEYLPFHCKQCFNYCSLFPKEYIFSKQQLVRMWLSQGFIEPVEGRELEDIGLEYFDQLLSRSFLQASFFLDMKEDRFVMPGLIHNLAQQLSNNECFQFEGCMERLPENARHLALVPHEFQLVSLRHLIIRAQNLQTILVVSRSAFQHQSVSSSILKFDEIKDLFIGFHKLVTLDLSNADIEELPEYLGSLNNLRYLGLSSTNIKQIPLEISNLIHLQTLEAKDCNYLGELPGTISALTNLYYLDVTKETGHVLMPNGIGKLTNLRNLPTIHVGMDPLFHCGIEELKDMKYLKGCLEISGLVNVRSVIDAKKADMKSKEHIETLCFQWSDGMSSLEGEGSEIADEILESLCPTENLNEIVIRGYPGNSFPMWIEQATFCRLVSIIFDNCYNCERLPALGGLPLLRFLSIRKMYGVQRMSLSGSEDTSENFIRYPSLEQLTIWEMYGLVEWIEIGNGHFPILHSLCINKCPLLRNVPKFPSLVELSVYSCAQFIEAVDLPSLQSLRVEGLQKTRSFILPKNLVRLKKLEINRCPELLSIEGLSLLNSLETIIAFRCARLDSPEILDERSFAYEDRGNTSVWVRKKNIACSDKQGHSDEGQDSHPTSLKRRKVANTPSPKFYMDNSSDGSDQRSEYYGDDNVLPGEEILPGIEGFQITGIATPGNMLAASGYPINGTTHCIFQWVRYHENGNRQSVDGATAPEYYVTADDVDTILAVDCTPLDGKGRQGELVRQFANNQNKITCGEEILPGIEGFQITGIATPGNMVAASGYSINGTTHCIFQWVRYHENGNRQSVDGATAPEYYVTADDVDTILAVDCTPLDGKGRQGELVRQFANNQNKITCDPEMQHEIDSYISTGEATFNIYALLDTSGEWELILLTLKRSTYQIKIQRIDSVFIEEKYSPELSMKVPFGSSTRFVLVSSGCVTVPFTTDGVSQPKSIEEEVRLRDLIVLTMRNFQNKALDGKKKGKAYL